MRRLICNLWLILLSTSLLTACNNGGDSPDPVPSPPTMLSSIPAEGAKEIPSGDITIELTFDMNVTAPSVGHSKITLGDATITSVAANLTKVTIQATGLKKATTYTLNIPEGVILGPAKAEAPELSISFTTAAPLELNKKLCTPNPSTQAQKVFDFLLANFGTKIISGSMANVSWNINEAEWVNKHTGKYPALNCFDFVHLYASPANWIDYGNTVVVEAWWNNRGLVAAAWHWNVPKTSASSDYGFYAPGKNEGNGETTFDIALAVQDGTPENQIIKADLEKMANYLLLLKEKNIPVIWRPLHEAAGAWFWWGAKGAAPCKALWKMMFDTFQAKGLNNLIWVWTSEGNDDAWYPGDDYVDIISRDIYSKQTAQIATEYKNLTDKHNNKMVTLSECGNVSKISLQWSAAATWSWFMPWYDYDRTNDPLSASFNKTDHQYANIDWWTDAINHNAVITRDEMPDLK